MTRASPGWYSVPLAVVELVPELSIGARSPPPPNPLGLVYVLVSPELRSRFYAAADRCSRTVHRLSERETRCLPPEPIATTAALSTFTDDRPHLARWLVARFGPFSATADRGSAAALLPSGLAYRIAWATDASAAVHRTVYLRLHGSNRSDLSRRYCSPFRRSDDPELVSFRRAIGALEPVASTGSILPPDPWEPM